MAKLASEVPGFDTERCDSVELKPGSPEIDMLERFYREGGREAQRAEVWTGAALKEISAARYIPLPRLFKAHLRHIQSGPDTTAAAARSPL
jgi:hypothetical protein